MSRLRMDAKKSVCPRKAGPTGATNGAWSTKEWFPSLVQASYKLGCLPSSKEDKVGIADSTNPFLNSIAARIVAAR